MCRETSLKRGDVPLERSSTGRHRSSWPGLSGLVSAVSSGSRCQDRVVLQPAPEGAKLVTRSADVAVLRSEAQAAGAQGELDWPEQRGYPVEPAQGRTHVRREAYDSLVLEPGARGPLQPLGGRCQVGDGPAGEPALQPASRTR